MGSHSITVNTKTPTISSFTVPVKNPPLLLPEQLQSLLHEPNTQKEPPILLKDKVTPLQSDQTNLFLDFQQNPTIIHKQNESVIKNLAEKKKKLTEDIRTWESTYKKWMKDLKEYGRFQGYGLDVLEYFHINRTNFVTGLAPFLSSEQTETLSEYLDSSNEAVKITGATAHVFLNAVKWFILNQELQDLRELENRYRDLDHQMHAVSSSQFTTSEESTKAIEERLDSLRQQLLEEQQSAQSKGINNLGKILSKAVVSPLTDALTHLTSLSDTSAKKIAARSGKCAFNIFKHFYHIYELYQARHLQREWIHHLKPRLIVDLSVSKAAQQELQEEAQAFLDSLAQCASLKEVKKQFKTVGLFLELPENFERWKQLLSDKRYCRYLIHSYYQCVGQQPVMNSAADMQTLLRQRQAAFEAKVEQSLPFIVEQIQICQEMDFAEIKQHFAALHVHFDRLESPPQDQQEWREKIQSEDFCLSLAKQWVDYQETSAQLAEQMMRQALLSKHHVESRFLMYHGIESLISIAFSVIQIALTIPSWALSQIWSLLQLLVTDVGAIIPGFGFAAILFPEINLKVDNVLLLFFEYLVGFTYKSHEYSVEGYKISFLIRWFKFASLIYTLINYSAQGILWSTYSLGTYIPQAQPIDVNTHLTQMQENLKQQQLNYKRRIKDLEECLHQLRLQDVRSMIQPDAPLQRENEQEFDPFENLAAALKDVDFNYFPPSILEFFEENLGIELTKVNPHQLKERIEKSFTLDDEDFIDSYRSHRAKFIKV